MNKKEVLKKTTINMNKIIKEEPQKLYKELEKIANENNGKVILDFKDVPLISTSYFNNSVGKFIQDKRAGAKEDKKGLIKVKNIDSDNLRTIRLVISNAKDNVK